MSDYFIYGFRIALPIFATTLLVNGISNISQSGTTDEYVCCWYAVKKYLQVYSLIFFTIVMLPSVSTMIEKCYKNINGIVSKGMSP